MGIASGGEGVQGIAAVSLDISICVHKGSPGHLARGRTVLSLAVRLLVALGSEEHDAQRHPVTPEVVPHHLPVLL
jgi:hypothetical protein